MGVYQFTHWSKHIHALQIQIQILCKTQHEYTRLVGIDPIDEHVLQTRISPQWIMRHEQLQADMNIDTNRH